MERISLFQLVMMILGFGLGFYNLSQFFGIMPIRNADEMDESELASRKKGLIISGIVMVAIGIVYTLKFFEIM